MGPHKGFDLQTAGIKLANARKEIERLKRENADLRSEIEALKLTIPEIFLAPGTYDYFTGNHPMKKDRPG